MLQIGESLAEALRCGNVYYSGFGVAVAMTMVRPRSGMVIAR